MSTPASPHTRRSTWTLLVLVLLAYLNSLGGSFQFDDFNVIVDNPSVHSLAAWADGATGIRPLLKLSYTLNWVVSPTPTGFHLVNLLLHLVNVVLVLQLVKCLPLPSVLEGRRHLIATGTALVFGLHPVATEAVTYISGRSVSFMSSFYLAALLCWIRGRRQQRFGLLAASCGLFVLAMLVKEVAISLPLALLLLELAGVCGPRRRWLWMLPATLCGVALLIIFAHERYMSLLLTSLLARTGADQLAGQLAALGYLVSRLWLPHQLNIDPQLDLLAPTAVMPTLLVMVGGILASASQLRARPWLALPLLLPLVVLLPTNSVLPRLDLVNERQLYLASPFLFWGLMQLVARCPPIWQRGMLVLAVAVLLPLTVMRNADYRSETALWQSAARLAPGKARVFNNLGYAWLQEGQPARARAAWLRALQLDPKHEQARLNLQRLEAAR